MFLRNAKKDLKKKRERERARASERRERQLLLLFSFSSLSSVCLSLRARSTRAKNGLRHRAPLLSFFSVSRCKSAAFFSFFFKNCVCSLWGPQVAISTSPLIRCERFPEISHNNFHNSWRRFSSRKRHVHNAFATTCKHPSMGSSEDKYLNNCTS